MRSTALVLLVVVLLSACGLGAQGRPEPVDVPESATTEPAPPGPATGPQVTVWFVRDSRLEPVQRPAPEPGVAAALDGLVVGPTPAEVVDGLRTALSPQRLTSDRPASADPVVAIAVSREFTEVAGSNQLLAVAQVVFTVTEFPGVDEVRVTADGQPVEVPTDDGLTAGPVGRDHFASVAPEKPQTPSTPPPGSPGEQAPGSTPSAPTTSPPTPAGPSTPGRRPTRRRRVVTGP